MLGSLLGALATSMLRANVSGFSWFQLLPGFGHSAGVAHALGLQDPHAAFVIPTAWTVVGAILFFAFLARKGLERAMQRSGPERYIPDSGITPRNIFEVLTEALTGIVGGTLGHKDAVFYFPFLAALFTYILVANLVGFIPGILPATEDFSTNFALALCVFVAFNVAGVARNGFGYFKHLWGPKLPMIMIPVNILILVVEAFGLLIRPATLSIRLTANIFADHLVAGVIRDLGNGLPSVLGFLGGALFPLPFYALGLLVCFLQAFVFTLLSTIYLSLAVAHEDHH